MSYTEFYCIPGTGNNKYAGSTESPPLIITTGGTWTSGVFVCSGAIDLSIITSGMFGAITPDSGTSAAFIGVITGVNDGTDTVTFNSGSQFCGGWPNTTGAMTMVIGGPWAGPSGTGDGGQNGRMSFPFSFIGSGVARTLTEPSRINFKNNAVYNISGFINSTIGGPVVFQGYTNTPGDRGKALFSSASTSTVIFCSSNSAMMIDFIFESTSSINNVTMINQTAGTNILILQRCILRGARGSAIVSAGSFLHLQDVEIFNCVRGNASASVLAITTTALNIDRLYLHDCTGTVTSAIDAGGNTVFNMTNSILDNISGVGITTKALQMTLSNIDFYKMRTHGIVTVYTNGGLISYNNIQNSNFIKSGIYDMVYTGTSTKYGIISNCGFGTGTMGAASGSISRMGGYELVNPIFYPPNITPWNNPQNKDFRIVLPQAIGVGYGGFQNATGYSNTNPLMNYPNIGAIQHVGFPQGMMR